MLKYKINAQILAHLFLLSYLCNRKRNKKQLKKWGQHDKYCNKTMTRNQEIANTILSQFGGHKFVVMTGAKNMVAVENGIRFNIGQNGSKANTVKVILNGDDTYTMQFIKQGREVNEYTILMRYADKGLSEQEFNETVSKAIEKAKKNAEPKTLKEYNGIYFDQLQPLFTEYTKMYTRLF